MNVMGRSAMRPILEVRHLRLVDAICRARSVTAAAATLNLSQSALSHQLLNLERDLGLPLFARVGKKMVPTAAAERMIVGGRRVLEELDATEAALLEAAADRRRPFRVAAGCNTLYPWLAAQVGRFSAAEPDVDPRIVFDVRGREAEALAAQDADLIVTSRPPEDRRLGKLRLFALETIAIVGEGDPLASSGADQVRWSDLPGRTIFIHDLAPRDEADLLTAAGGLGRPPRLVPVQLTEAIVALARAGQGIGLISRWPAGAVGPELAGVRCMPFRAAHMRTFFAVWREAREVADVAERFANQAEAGRLHSLAS